MLNRIVKFRRSGSTDRDKYEEMTGEDSAKSPNQVEFQQNDVAETPSTPGSQSACRLTEGRLHYSISKISKHRLMLRDICRCIFLRGRYIPRHARIRIYLPWSNIFLQYPEARCLYLLFIIQRKIKLIYAMIIFIWFKGLVCTRPCGFCCASYFFLKI